MNNLSDYIIFKNNLNDETIDDLLEDRKLYLKYKNKYQKYIKIIEEEIEKRLTNYGLSCFIKKQNK